VHYRLKLLAAYLLALNKRACDCVEPVDMLFEDILGSAVSRGDNAVDFLIDLCGGLLGIVLQVRIISAEEHFVVA